MYSPEEKSELGKGTAACLVARPCALILSDVKLQRLGGISAPPARSVCLFGYLGHIYDDDFLLNGLPGFLSNKLFCYFYNLLCTV